MIREKIRPDQLIYLTEDCREMIIEFMERNKYSNNKASIIFKVHPAQLSKFLKSDQGFNITTMQRIGEIIAEDYNLIDNGNVE